MGLDMYLYADKYVSGHKFSEEEERERYAKLVELSGLEGAVDPETPSAHVKVTVAYWRKANQIHKWFVDNVQGGEDECRPHYVERSQLVELRDLCRRLLTNRDKAMAEEHLPPQAGFFFGTYEIDEWYWKDLEDTVEQLDRALGGTEEYQDFEYCSSW